VNRAERRGCLLALTLALSLGAALGILGLFLARLLRGA